MAPWCRGAAYVPWHGSTSNVVNKVPGGGAAEVEAVVAHLCGRAIDMLVVLQSSVVINHHQSSSSCLRA